MLALLKDPIWQFVGAVLALIAIAVTVWVYFAQRTKKRLLVERVARMPLIAIGPNKIPGLAITVNNQPIAEATVVLIRVTNIGNAPLIAADFEAPVTLTFGPRALVIHAEVSESNPVGLSIAVKHVDNVVEFQRQLLNPGDSFSCRVLVQDSLGKYATTGRVVGVKVIETSARPRIGSSVAIVGGMLLVGFSVLLSPKPEAANVLKIASEEIPYLVVAVAGMVISSAFALAELVSRLKRVRESMSLLRRGDA